MWPLALHSLLSLSSWLAASSRSSTPTSSSHSGRQHEGGDQCPPRQFERGAMGGAAGAPSRSIYTRNMHRCPHRQSSLAVLSSQSAGTNRRGRSSGQLQPPSGLSYFGCRPLCPNRT
jgi:hypothetical protein